MSTCLACGNQIVIPVEGQICLVCQHTGRAIECLGFDPAVPGTDRTVTEIRACQSDAAARGLASALDAVYAALANFPKPEADLTPEQRVNEAQVRLRHRIRNSEHNRDKPDWLESDEEERDREKDIECLTCQDTGRYGSRRCPDCYEQDERD